MIFVQWGEDKSCKSTLSMSFPKPIVNMEFDIGGFDRANRNLPHLPIRDWVDQGLIRNESYVMPFPIGSIDLKNMSITPSKIIVGMKELFYDFAVHFIAHLKDDNIKTIVVDTGTLLYDVTCSGYLQEKQEVQLDASGNLRAGEKALRVSLLPIEYREPYTRMRGFAYQAKAHGKHLVVNHHASDQYGRVPQKDGSLATDKTGKRELHGWSQWGDSADVVVHTYIAQEEVEKDGVKSTKPVPYCEVELAEVLTLVGMKFREPTYEIIQKAIQFIKGE